MDNFQNFICCRYFQGFKTVFCKSLSIQIELQCKYVGFLGAVKVTATFSIQIGQFFQSSDHTGCDASKASPLNDNHIR
jgi:hypothetical protein